MPKRKLPVNECFDCGFEISRYSHQALTIHILKHLPDQHCDECGRDLATVGIHHTHTGKSYRCAVCDRRFLAKRSIFTHHYNSHELVDIHRYNPMYVCFTCGDSLYWKQPLVNHPCIRKERGIEIELYFCNVCREGFERKTALISHTNLHLAEHLRLKEAKKKTRDSADAKPFSCNVCAAEFDHKMMLHDHHYGRKSEFICDCCCRRFMKKWHLQTHRRQLQLAMAAFVCFACKRRFHARADIQGHSCIRISAKKPYVCFVCSKGYTMKYNLRLHNLTHTSKPSVECADCPYRSTTKCTMIRHVFNVHLGVAAGKRNICSVCAREFCTGSSMWRHYRGVHLRQRPFACFDCDLGSVSKRDLILHQQATHLKLRLYTCFLCCRAFAAKYDFMRHVRERGPICDRIARMNKRL